MGTGERREAAIKRIEAKREFWTHLFIYIAVNTLLIVIWALTSGGFFWPIFPLLGWLIGLGAHALETFRHPIREDAIRREMEKM